MKYIQLILLAVFMIISNFAEAQCDEFRHSTSWFDAWVSCEPSSHPIDGLPSSHWIRYDLGEVYTLGRSHIWNLNDPANLDMGIARYRVDYSSDGADWTMLGTFDLSQASGRSVYAGEEAAFFGGVTARYVIITALATHGGACAGLSEVRIELTSFVNIADEESVGADDACVKLRLAQNPVMRGGEGSLMISNSCDEELNIMMVDMDGTLINQWRAGDVTGETTLTLNAELASGQYIIHVRDLRGESRASVKWLKL